MKKFVIRLSFFFFILFILDRGVGEAMKYLHDNPKGGLVGHRNYILYHSNADVLIFGSSRALHHYNPQIISDSLSLSCVNCGVEGMGIPMFYGWWKIIKKRYKPKMIVYEITPKYDIYSGEDNHKYLRDLKECYDESGISEIFDQIDKKEGYKMMSYMYRYNSIFLQIMGDYIRPMISVGENGFTPIKGEFDPMQTQLAKENNINISSDIDSIKIAFFESFIKDVKYEGVELLFVLSPVWYNQTLGDIDWLSEICKKNEIPLYDFSSNMKYIHKNVYFKDGVHLNSKGADEFTRDFVKVIKPHLK